MDAKRKKFILLRKPADVAQNWSGSWEENHFKTMAVTQRHVHVVKSTVNNHLLIRVIIEYLWPAKRWMGLIWMNFTNQNKTPWWSCLWDPQVSQWSFLLRCQLFFSVRDIFVLLLTHRIQFSWNKESHWQLKSFLLCSYFMTPIFESASFSLIFFLVYCTLAKKDLFSWNRGNFFWSHK